MKKRKSQEKARKSNFSNSKLFELLLSVFRKNRNKKFNYKQVSKILNIKDVGARIQVIEVMKLMSQQGVLEEVQRGAYRIIEKTSRVIVKIKNTNSTSVFADFDEGCEIVIRKENSCFALSGDEVEVLLFPKKRRKNRRERC